MKALSSLYRWIVKAEEFCSKLLLVAIIILCFISALARYMNFTVTWSLDLVLLLFSWFAFPVSYTHLRICIIMLINASDAISVCMPAPVKPRNALTMNTGILEIYVSDAVNVRRSVMQEPWLSAEKR